MKEFVVMNRVFVETEWTYEFEDRFNKRKGEIEKVPGFIIMKILKPVSNKAPYIVLTHWDDESAFKLWLKSDDFKLAHQNPMPQNAFNEGGGLETFEVVISS